VWDDGTSASKANLEVCTDDNSMGPLMSQPPLKIQVQQVYSPVTGGKDKHGYDLIIGLPGMQRLGLGIDHTYHKLVKVKRVLRK